MLASAIRIARNGGPEVLSLQRIEVEPPAFGEIQIRQTAIGLNFIDIHHRTGRYPSPSFPVVLGMEAAGVVVAVGPGAGEFEPGERVAYFAHTPGAYTELRNIAADRVVKLPAGIDDETAAAVMLKGLTVQSLLHSVYPVKPGQTILLHAAAGGIGLLMCQWARKLGATVIGTVGSDEKADLARRHGCNHTIVYTSEDVTARVRDLTDGAGVPVVYDAVGRSTFDISLACLMQRGTLVSFGTASGPIPPLDLFRLNLAGSLYVTSASVFTYTRQRAEYLERVTDLFSVLRAEAVRVPIHHRYPLAEAERAHRDLEARRTSGCSILVP